MEKKSEHICPICREELDKNRIFTPCMHGFHDSCMAMCVQSYDCDDSGVYDDKNVQCPVCRRDLDYEFVEYVRSSDEYKKAVDTFNNSSRNIDNYLSLNETTTENNFFETTAIEYKSNNINDNLSATNVTRIHSPRPISSSITRLIYGNLDNIVNNLNDTRIPIINNLNVSQNNANRILSNTTSTMPINENKMHYDQYPRVPIVDNNEIKLKILEHINGYKRAYNGRNNSIIRANRYANIADRLSQGIIPITSNEAVDIGLQNVNIESSPEYTIRRMISENNAIGHRMDMDYHLQMIFNYLSNANSTDRTMILNLMREHIPDYSALQVGNLYTMPTSNQGIQGNTSNQDSQDSQGNTSNMAQTSILDNIIEMYKKNNV